jgi:hypothetical protein
MSNKPVIIEQHLRFISKNSAPSNEDYHRAIEVVTQQKNKNIE